MSPSPGVPEIVERVRRHLCRRAWSAASLWAACASGAVLLAAWLLAGGGGWRGGTPVPLALDLLLALVLGVGAWFLRRRLPDILSDARVSESVEEAAGLRSGEVLGTLELSRELPRGVSGSLAGSAAQQVARRLGSDEKRLAGPLGKEAATWNRRGWWGLTILAASLVVVTLLSPARSATAWKGLTQPVRLLAGPVLPALGVTPGDVEVRRGTSVAVVVTAPLRDSVTLHWQAAGDVARSGTAEVGRDTARFTLDDVQVPVRYRASAPDGAETETFEVTPVDPLLVADVTVEAGFPPHTGLAPEEYRGDVPPLVLPAGTRLSIRGRASRNLSSGRLVDSTGTVAADFDVAGPDFEGRWSPRGSGRFEWAFEDADGAPAEVTPLPLDVTVVPDSAPTVRFTFPGRDTVLPMNLRQTLVLQASDDYGVRDLELVAYRVTSLGERKEPVVQGVGLGGSRAVMARPVMNVSDWGLLPGDTVRYFARVRDNAPSVHTAVTPEYALRMPGAAELRRSAGERLDEAARQLEELGERVERSEMETRNLERRAAANRERTSPRVSPLRRSPEAGDDPVGFEEREDVRRALEDQASMESEVDSLREELREMSEAMTEAGMSDPGLREDLDELQRLLEEIASPEQRERLREMTQELNEMGGERARQTLEELREEQERFRERIERSLERFKRAAVEQDFRATTQEAEELARQEDALADAFREEDDPEGRAEQQEELEGRAEETEGRMERLERRLQELGETDAAREVREARERSSQAREAMQQAGRQARQQQGRQAGEWADQAAEGLEEAVQKLQDAQQQMADQQAAAAERALREAAEDALTLARRQTEVREQMSGAGQDRMADLRGDVAAVEQGVRSLAENLSAATGGQAGESPEITERLGQAMSALQRTVEAMERRSGASPSPQGAAEQAVDALNQVALMAMAGAQQMAQSGQQQGQSTGQGELQEQLENLAQQQGQVNNRAGQMMPMQLGQQAMQAQMQQIAQGQQAVASGLGELADEPGNQERALGDLQALAQEARELVEELTGGRLDATTRERQERLFHRLLDAGRSLEKEEYSEERESERPGAFERADVLPLGPEALRALRFRLPGAAVLGRLAPAERRLVLQYFERLNRGGGGGGAAASSGGGGGTPPGGGGGR